MKDSIYPQMKIIETDKYIFNMNWKIMVIHMEFTFIL